MSGARVLISKALEIRKNLNLPVRQPLTSISFKHENLSDSLKDIISDELNVKMVIFDPNLTTEANFDTNLTDELIEEGKLRVIIRAIQEARKNSKLKVGQYVDVKFFASDEEKNIINKNSQMLSEQTSIKNFQFESGEFAIEILDYDNK
jgi:isoleucyl-tRNA synthetase